MNSADLPLALSLEVVVKDKRETRSPFPPPAPGMTKKRKNVGVTAKIMEPLLTVPEPRISQGVVPVPAQTKYIKLLRIIELLGRDLKLFYTGNNVHKTLPKVERDIARARSLIQQCLAEAAKNAKKAF